MSQKSVPGYRAGSTVTPRSIIASFTVRPQYVGGVIDATYAYDGSQSSGKEQQLRPGIPMARLTSSKLWVPCKRTRVNGSSIGTTLTVDDNRLFQLADTLTIRGKQRIQKITDDDSAASNGTAVYLHLDELGESPFGHLESVTAGNVDSTFTIGSGGPVVKVEDDDAAATGGVQIYYDEDATNPDERLLAAVPTGKDAFILASDGRALRIKYNASPSTPGVALYFDDDGASAHLRLLFVSPTNADGIVATDDQVGGSDLLGTEWITRASALATSAISYANNTFTIAATDVLDGDEVYADTVAGAEICRGFLDEFVDMVDDDDNTARDRLVSKIVVAGCLNDDMILGDLDAIRAAVEGTDKYTNQISWADQQGFAAETST